MTRKKAPTTATLAGATHEALATSPRAAIHIVRQRAERAQALRERPSHTVPRKKHESDAYEVTLRRDVQQVALVRLEASAPQEAINIAEANAAEDETAWKIEEYIGSHKPEVRRTRLR